MNDRRQILLLPRTDRRQASNVSQHIEALRQMSRHDVSVFNPVDRPDAAALLDLDEFDVVVVHYTIAVMYERYLPSVLRGKLAAFGGLKAQFIQDEYRTIDAVTARMGEMGISLVFTCVSTAEAPKVYGSVPGLRAVTTLPGYVPVELVGRSTPPPGRRPVDVGHRGRTIPFWLGRLGYEKFQIGEGFAGRAAEHGLRVDISADEGDRMYGEGWNRFMSSCRATLGTESGASIADFDGSVEAQVKDYLARHADAGFEEVDEAVLALYEGNVVINTVSPGVFEAAALRTAMVLFPGAYSGTAEPWTHYLPLEKDFSNMDEIAAQLLDLPAVEAMTERAYEDLVASGRYSVARFVTEFDERVAEASTGGAPGPGRAYARARRRSLFPPASALPLHLVGNAARPAVMTALTIRDPTVRRLAWHGARGDVDRAALAHDLWRLAALRRGVRAGLFSAAATLEESGRRLVITTSAEPTERGDADGFAEALSSGSVEELILNHKHVGADVPPSVWRSSSRRWAQTEAIPSARRGSSSAQRRTTPPAALEPLLRALA